MARISIVIPVHQERSTLNRCLQSLAENTCQDFQVLIVDHGPGSTALAENFNPPGSIKVDLLKASPDLWWAGATNVGIRKALEEKDLEYIMLLNHDCFLDRDAILELLECADTNSRSIVAPVQVNSESGKILVRTAYTAYLFGFPTVIPPPGQEKNNLPKRVRTGLITGGRGVLIPRETFSQVGLLDEIALPHYGADNDFFLRSKTRGYSLYICNRAKVLVDSSHTTAAARIGNMSISQFLLTLKDRKSHRNLVDMVAHFKKHYPVPGFYLVGVALNLFRYTFIYLVLRCSHLIFYRKQTGK